MTGFASLSAANPIPDGLLAQAEEHWEQPWSDYLVLADWLLEQGHDDHAECLHWLVRHRRRCYKSFGGNFQWTCTSIWRDPSEIQYRSYLPLVLRPPGFIPLRGSYTHAIREVLSSWTIVKHKQPESIAELLALSVVGAVRVLPYLGLLELQHTEAGPALAYLRSLGYRWLQDRPHGHHNLYDQSGLVCVGEMWNNRLYLDECVKADLDGMVSGSFLSGQTELTDGTLHSGPVCPAPRPPDHLEN